MAGLILTRNNSKWESKVVATKSGLTLIEMLVVIVIAGALVLFSVPRLLDNSQKRDVRGAKRKVVALFYRSRSLAIETNRHVTLRLGPTMAMITSSVPGGGEDTVVVEDFAAYGVGLASSIANIQLDPRGVAYNLGVSTALITMSKSGYADTVRISGFGRVMSP
ncbi:MAG: prepilin-type N-terminal cleavage/methylation domain-containing protein [Gemmatimonadetes bacterium]|nr:prepilin-type N-terminal cleavage/methylation domain-containing protein [Gemmatimonadota bacterium]